MTHQEKLTAVRQKIIEACPESWELMSPHVRHIPPYHCCPDCFCTIQDVHTHSSIKPRLEHVLRALYQKEMKSGRLDIFVDLSFRFWKITNTNGVNDLKIISHWIPTKDLSGQREATIDFLYSVFYGN